MRINQYVAAATGLSRRAADTAVTAGRVTIDGKVAILGQIVGPNAKVTLDKATVSLPATHTYIMLHKPAGYVTSRARQGRIPTIYELLPPPYSRLRPAGRLDQESSGLLLLSNDGLFIQHLTHPSYGKTKRYELTLDCPVTTNHQQELEEGVDLTDGPSRLHVVASHGRTLTVELAEGRNRQIRRTMGALGYTISRLHRTEVGPFCLDQLKPGTWTIITPEAGS